MGLWIARLPLVLASKSAVRRAVLESAGIPVEVRTADIDERAIESAAGLEDPGAVAALLAREKARKVAGEVPGRLVIGADQTLSLDGRRFSKPTSRDAARDQLLALKGRTHELHSAVTACRDGTVGYEDVDVARMTMRDFSARLLESYLNAAGAAVCDSVGGYQLESLGVQLFERVEGDHFTVLGLPLLRLLAYLRREGSVAQ
jgi:nucleoside triphosphate pyrophosphatase